MDVNGDIDACEKKMEEGRSSYIEELPALLRH
jgi:hypothetical protein